ncbi:MAG: serine hydrolase domain-containing protein [Acidobacteriota bacterium]|nr:serine hydrolase domain-containing protein [Acidobacteriota bacterium]
MLRCSSLLCGLFFVVAGFTQDTGAYRDLLSKFQERLDSSAQQKPGLPLGPLPGISAAVRFPDIDHAFPLVSGYADPSPRSAVCPDCPVKMSADHLIEVGSVTKTFTSALVLQLVRAGKISLDDTLNTLVPQVVNDRIDGYATLHQVMRMTSGTADFIGNTQYQDDGDWQGFAYQAASRTLDWIRDKKNKEQLDVFPRILGDKKLNDQEKLSALSEQTELLKQFKDFSRTYGVAEGPMAAMLTDFFRKVIDDRLIDAVADPKVLREKLATIYLQLLIRYNQLNRIYFQAVGLNDFLARTTPPLYQAITYLMPYNGIGSLSLPLFAPGTNWGYSNTNYVIAGMILEGLLADPFLTWSFRHRFYERLDGKNILMGGPELYDLDRLATSWSQPGQNQKNWSRMSFYTAYWTAGAMVSTPTNIADWLFLLFGTEQILDKKSREKMVDFRTIPNQIPTPDGVNHPVEGFNWNGYGLGIMRFMIGLDGNENPTEVWGYWGATHGFNCLAAYIVEANASVVIGANRRGDIPETRSLELLRDFTRDIIARKK